MSWEQAGILVVLGCTLAAFVWDRWRYDVVALTSLLVCVPLGLVAPEAAFAGFSNPAVITVAAVLVISRAVARSGAIDALAGRLIDASRAPLAHLAWFTLLGAALSGFMNNIGALALLLPVALSTARRHGYAPGFLLMPLSFATLLGGMITLIGTPPNLLISAFRAEATGQRFLLFDFAPTGLALSAAGIAYLLLIGWRLLPAVALPEGRPSAFEVRDYVTEARILPSSPADRRCRRRLRGAAARSACWASCAPAAGFSAGCSGRCCRPTTFSCCRPIRPLSNARSRRTVWSSSNVAPASCRRAARRSA